MSNKQVVSPTHSNYFLEQRVSELEKVVFKKKGKEVPPSKSQKILLLKELGLMDAIHKILPGRNKKALLLSILLGDNESNINKEDSFYDHIPNTEFLIRTYEKLDLKDHLKKANDRLVDVLRKSEK